jgi:hypothetical protein
MEPGGSIINTMAAADVTDGRVFRAVSRHGTARGKGVSENVVWYVVRNPLSKKICQDHRPRIGIVFRTNGWVSHTIFTRRYCIYRLRHGKPSFLICNMRAEDLYLCLACISDFLSRFLRCS